MVILFFPVNLIFADSEIPDWIRNNAKWWAEGAIGDNDFIQGIQYLIKNRIMNIADLPKSSEKTQQYVPDWVKNNAEWWSKGLISDDDFVMGIKYLIKNDFIKIKTEVSEAEIIFNECGEEMHCVILSFNDFGGQNNQEEVLETFVEIITLYDQSQYPCHQISHHFGMWLFGYIGTVEDSLQYAKQQCGGGIFHGIIENFFTVQRFNQITPEQISLEKLCPKIQGHQYSIERWQCLHGIGHGLVVYYDYDVFTATEQCEVFEPGWEQLSCTKGIFMQNVVYNYKTNQGDFEKTDSLYPCNQIDEKFAPACYHYHTSYLLKQNNFSLVNSFKDCDNISPESLIKYCYYGMGRQLSSHIKGTAENALFLCKLGPQSNYHSECITGVLLTLVNENTNADKGFQYCKIMPDEFKENCYDGLGKWIHMLFSSDLKIAKECSRAEDSHYTEVCKTANLEAISLL